MNLYRFLKDIELDQGDENIRDSVMFWEYFILFHTKSPVIDYLSQGD